MAYVRREDGKIVTVCPDFVEGMAEEEVANDNAELLAFLNKMPRGEEFIEQLQATEVVEE